VKTRTGEELPEALTVTAEAGIRIVKTLEAAGWEFGDLYPYHEGGGYWSEDGAVWLFGTGDELPEGGEAQFPLARMSGYQPDDPEKMEPVDFQIALLG
jgi:hypothetical protein